MTSRDQTPSVDPAAPHQQRRLRAHRRAYHPRPERQLGQAGLSIVKVTTSLYVPTLVAIRFDADMKAQYQALIAATQPPTVAINALMRQLNISPTNRCANRGPRSQKQLY